MVSARAQLEAGGAALTPTTLNVLLALEPRVVTAAMHTTMIRASITAYSTAVGPSSRFRKVTNFLARLFIISPLCSLSFTPVSFVAQQGLLSVERSCAAC